MNNLKYIYEELTFKFNDVIIINDIIELKFQNDFTIQIFSDDENFNVTMVLFYLSTEILNSRAIIHKRNIIDTIYNFIDIMRNDYCNFLYKKLLQDFSDNDYVINNIIDEIRIKLPGAKDLMLVISTNVNFTKIELMKNYLLIESTGIKLFSYAKIHDLINFYIDTARLIMRIELDV